mgnify:CR=1 FL=1
MIHPPAKVRRLFELIEPIATTSFSEQVDRAFREVGMRDFWDGYFAGRAAPLGLPCERPVERRTMPTAAKSRRRASDHRPITVPTINAATDPANKNPPTATGPAATSLIRKADRNGPASARSSWTPMRTSRRVTSSPTGS